LRSSHLPLPCRLATRVRRIPPSPTSHTMPTRRPLVCKPCETRRRGVLVLESGQPLPHGLDNTLYVLFLSPGFVSSTYSESAVSLASSALAFFSLFFEVTGAVAALAFFSSNFLAFSAFLRSFSTTKEGQVVVRSPRGHGYIAGQAPGSVRSFSLFAFFGRSLPPPESCPIGSGSEAFSGACTVSEEAGGGCPEPGPVLSPAMEIELFTFGMCGERWKGVPIS
jgi:hypothetical protein